MELNKYYSFTIYIKKYCVIYIMNLTKHKRPKKSKRLNKTFRKTYKKKSKTFRKTYKKKGKTYKGGEPPMMLLDWIEEERLVSAGLSANPNILAMDLLEERIANLGIDNAGIDWANLSKNPTAVDLLKKYPDKINWSNLSQNPNAIDLLRENLDRINWQYLSSNPNAIDLLREHPEEIDWNRLSSNPNAIDLLKENQSKINWNELSGNPNAIDLLRENKGKINWIQLSSNPNAIDLLRENQGRIVWTNLSSNPNAIDLLRENPGRINWNNLTNWAITMNCFFWEIMIRYFGVHAIQCYPANTSNQWRQIFCPLHFRYIMGRACKYNMISSKVGIVRCINIIGMRYFYNFLPKIEMVVFVIFYGSIDCIWNNRISLWEIIIFLCIVIGEYRF